MNIGDKIRELRVRKGFSQENMADLLDMTVTGYAKIEQNKTPNISLKRLGEIAEKLDTNVFELLSLGEKNIYYVNHVQDSNYSGLILQQTNNSDQLLAQENAFLKEKIQDQQTEIQNLKKIIALLEAQKA